LRVTLLDRDSRHVELTEVGRRFHRDTERILGDLDRAIAGVVKQAGIRLGFSWLLPDPWAQRTFQRFERSSGGAVRLTRCDDVVAALKSHRIDAGLLWGQVSSSSIRTVALFRRDSGRGVFGPVRAGRSRSAQLGAGA
jgi:DNA-binding transcriptional LysR family regulator